MSFAPDFFVIGAQKAGTTSLCAWLEQQKNICFSKPKEPFFFSRDEVVLHPHFFVEEPDQWERFDWNNKKDALLEGYQTHFDHAKDGNLLGEGSTSYLTSQFAAQRIAEIKPEAKIVVVLRDPAKRAYSAYWHYVRCGIACESFLKHIQYESGHTIAVGEYVRHIELWLNYFPKEQLHFMLHEELLEDADIPLTKLAEFLGLKELSDPILPKENTGKNPRLLWLQLALNYIKRRSGANHNAIEKGKNHWLVDLLRPVEAWNLTDKPHPAMPYDLHHRLDMHYNHMNARLEELTGLDVSKHWYSTLS